MTRFDSRKLVDKGFKMLTAHYGGTSWVNEIDLARLDTENPYRCILGQLFGDYGTGRSTLGIGFDNGGEYGFDAPDMTDRQYEALDKRWTEKITEARQ